MWTRALIDVDSKWAFQVAGINYPEMPIESRLRTGLWERRRVTSKPAKWLRSDPVLGSKISSTYWAENGECSQTKVFPADSTLQEVLM